MRKVQYGSKTIEYSIQEKPELKSHYITVEKYSGVVLKGKPISPDKAEKLILKKASWILEKLQLVGADVSEDIVTGSRITYLGKSYYVEVVPGNIVQDVTVEFNYSRFKVYVPSLSVSQDLIQTAFAGFFKEKAIEKIKPRVKKLAAKHQLPYNGLSFRKMSKRWGSCTSANKIILNPDAIKLPYTLIDYLIVHELCHTKVKDHSKAFWAELSKHVPNWKELDERVKLIR